MSSEPRIPVAPPVEPEPRATRLASGTYSSLGRLLLVASEASLVEQTASALEQEGYAVDFVPAEPTPLLANAGRYDATIVHVLPGSRGLDLCRSLCGRAGALAVIALLGPFTTDDIAQLLLAGVCAWIPLECGVDAVVSAIRMNLRRSTFPPPPPELPPLVVEVRRSNGELGLFVRGQHVEGLTCVELRIVECLCRHAARREAPVASFVPYPVIAAETGLDANANPQKSIRSHAHSIRGKMGDEGKRLQTEHSLGLSLDID